jgi:antibiotic biosynthesis monooxygenase (ABM) superfamily enzyme
MLHALQAFPGFLERELLNTVEGIQPETVVVLTFDSSGNLQRWFDSEARRTILEDLERISEGELTTNVVGGFAGWFPSHEGSDPKKWKQALIILMALFPVSLSASWVRAQLWPELELARSVLFDNVVGIIVLTWVLMPPLTRTFDSWLRS